MYYIDSNTYIYFDKNVSQALTAKMLAVNPANMKIPSMVVAELRLGVEKARDVNTIQSDWNGSYRSTKLSLSTMKQRSVTRKSGQH